jgi:galactitol PTS system EIIA component
MFRRDLCWVRMVAENRSEVLHRLSRTLLEQGLVRPTFEEAVLAREACSPTGLPLPGRKIALPHTDPEHVLRPAIAVCTLDRPVGFGEMGNPRQELSVEVVAMLALPDHQSAQHELVRLVERCQDPVFVDELWSAPTADELWALLLSKPIVHPS